VRRISGEIVQWILGGRHQLVDFGVERHTLVTGKITQVFHHYLAVVTQGPAARAHLFRVRAQLLRRFSGSTHPIQGEFIDSPPTHFKRKARRIFYLVPRPILTVESLGRSLPEREGRII
jgi:hypothetical protein